MDNVEDLFSRLNELYPELVTIRRDLHMHPELSFQEVHTPKRIAEYLKGLGMEVRTEVGGRGVVGRLSGGKSGPTVALRADFDALPIQDAKDVPYRSRVPGVMHACGHDIHTAALLGTAKVLSEVKDDLAGNVVFIHQFAEEVIPGGAKPMIEDGCLDGVDAVYSAHVASHYPVGSIAVGEGYRLAAGDTFEIEIEGRGGHGAMPHLAVDPIVIGSQLVQNLQHVTSRLVNPLKSAVLTVGAFNGGSAYNVIPDSVKLLGTVRTFEEDVRLMIEQTIGKLTASVCEGAGATFRYRYERGYPAVWNEPAESARITRAGSLVVGESNVIHDEPSMGMEDFAYYLQKVPGAFFWVGGRNEKIGASYAHHHPKFDVDEQAMLNIGKVYLAVLGEWMRRKA